MTEEQSTPPDQPGTQEGAADGRPPLARSERHRVVAGVCGGLGRHLDIDPVVFRVVTAVLCLTGGLGLFVYGLAWLIVPDEREDPKHGRTELQRVLTGRVDGQSIGAVLMTVIGTGVFFSWMGSGDSILPLLLLAAMVFFAVRHDPERRRRARGQAAPPRPAGPYDRATATAGGPGDGPALTDWDTWRQDFHTQWTARKAEFHTRVNLAKEGFTAPLPPDAPTNGTDRPPTDAPPTGRGGYHWDPRHPERNPWGAGPPPGMPAQPWWQRTDLPAGDPLRKTTPDLPPRAPRPRRERRRGSGLGLLGLLLAGGAGWAVWAGGHQGRTVPATTVLATGLLVLGLTMLVGSRWGRARWLAVPALALTLALAGLGDQARISNFALGDRNWAPATAAELQPRYALGLGDIHLDLTSLDPAGATLRSQVQLGAGNVEVQLPPGTAADLNLRVVAGDIQTPDDDGSTSGGLGTRRTVHLDPVGGGPAHGTIDLTIEVGFGEIQVVQ
ncbi:PspC domain-containing protein [Kitasatospora viridis]|uniref:Phage shock protein C (PspC) family protein n=1 Tax=Kitasatospora viridis TaxID=281105 RepID=A0A561UJJ6_9ACTN|nr:PspC domain-containing protein [Kitasatospora viridis]TWF99541.1 phage shock protein C (PspC) family protein [Kitasatospora viridis]